MTVEQIKDEINGLALSEKLRLVEDIWDSIAAENAEIPLPEWQKQELDRRRREYEETKPTLHDWQSVQDLRDRLKGDGALD